LNEIPLGALFGALAFLLMLSAFFSGSETALMTLNRYRLRHLADGGHPGARLADRLLRKPDRLIGLILLGNNFVNILASSLATIIALRLGGEGAIPIAAGLLTLVILVFSEVAPKTMAALYPERLAFPAAWVYTPLLRLLFPLVWFVNLLANGVLRALHIYPKDADGTALSREELRTVVIEAGAMIPKRHQKMLLNILDLEKITVDDIMVPRSELDGIDLDQPFDTILEQIEKTQYTRLLMYRDSIDNVIGFIHAARPHAGHAQGRGGPAKSCSEQLMRDPLLRAQGHALNQPAAQLPAQAPAHRPGGDEYGDVQGLVTMADLLEEIVGEFTTDPREHQGLHATGGRQLPGRRHRQRARAGPHHELGAADRRSQDPERAHH
jgi:Mg2+/Co2+ transporter CorB